MFLIWFIELQITLNYVSLNYLEFIVFSDKSNTTLDKF